MLLKGGGAATPARTALGLQPQQQSLLLSPPACSGGGHIPLSTAPAIGAQPVAAAPLCIGPLHLWPPLVAAPMAGISCAPYRRLCTAYGAQMATSEMVVSSTFVLGHRRSRRNAKLHGDEALRSVQLYGVHAEQLQEVGRSRQAGTCMPCHACACTHASGWPRHCCMQGGGQDKVRVFHCCSNHRHRHHQPLLPELQLQAACIHIERRIHPAAADVHASMQTVQRL